MKWNVGTKIGLGFALALAILVAIGGTAYRSLGKLTDAAEWVDHTHQVLATLQGSLQAITEAESSVRGYVLTGEDRYLDPYRAGRTTVDQAVANLRELTKDNLSEQQRIGRLEPLLTGADGKFAISQAMIDARKSGPQGFDAALKLVRSDRGKQVMDEILRVMGEMRDEEMRLLKVRADEAQASAANASLSIILGTVGAFIVLGIAGFVITRNIAAPLGEISASAARIAVGDLSGAPSSVTRSDEVGILARTFSGMRESLNGMAAAAARIASGDLKGDIRPQSDRDVLGIAFASMITNLRRLTADITEGVNVLGSSANEISASTTQLASSAAEAATAVSETTTTVEEVRQTAQVASQKARNVAESAQKMAQVSVTGRKAAEEMGGGMNRIRQQMEGIAASMMRLSEQSQAIGQIIATVEDLAAQSNLLAVNAAIEAAKAGEHGKGFGVVAQEVKSLAEQSRQATNQVRTILVDIQEATTAAAMATEQGSKAVEVGVRQAGESSESIQSLAASVSEAAQAATQIAASSQQQQVGVDQVAAAMESIRQASSQNVASAKQLETAARNLSDLGQRLKQMVAQYKV